ncbi:MAG TPA: DALR anticodon-binding domain-containing protein [Streptosporangiaceae bacterium]|nr:DALR anticodon-binding domain-containing protein [Streptosporangiaceae bacterium]
MITADVRRAVWEAAQAAGELPVSIAEPGQPEDRSTLRPVPAELGGGPGQYASTLPYLLASQHRTANQVAAVLAGRLGEVPWIAWAAATDGYLTVTVTDEALAGLAVRIPAAESCSRSDILRGMSVAVPPTAALTAMSWADARVWLAAEIIGRLATEAGADIYPSIRMGPAYCDAAGAPIQAAITYAGRDAVKYALISQDRPTIDTVPVRHHLDNPLYAVRYAHAHAVSTLRQAADLGLSAGEAGEIAPRLLGRPPERALLDAMSWLPERVAWAVRRGRPGEFARYLEELASAYHDCRESCPALPFGGSGAPRSEGTLRARLWLVTAARTAIGAGLGLLGIDRPARL